MSLICSTKIDGKVVELLKQNHTILNKRQLTFNGQKLLHPFVTKIINKQITKTGKGNKPVIQNFTEMIYLPEYLPEALGDILKAVRFEMKVDGSCGFLYWNPATDEFVPYCRLDIRKEKGGFPDVPKNGIPCEPMPTDPNATHWPHFVPCSNDPKGYKWYIHAFEQAKKSGKLDIIFNSFTVEYMGKKFNYKPCDGVDQDAVIVPHGLVTLEIPIELRNYNGFRKIFEEFSFMEGIIVYGEKQVWKIRREMFSDDAGKLKWPSDSTEKISEQVMFA